jgi:molecular chaperone GrpE
LALNHQVEDEAVQSFVQGFKMIQDQIKKGLEEEGVSEIDALNEEYDPNFHQAIMTEKKEGVEPNVVIEVLQKGYIFKDRVIRPAIVKISE